jgi:superfamily I DNA and/or RNA helicase
MIQTATSRELDDLLAGCLQGLDEEILAVRDQLAARGLSEPVRVSDGRVADTAGAIVYEWRLPSARLDVRPNDAVRVRCDAGEAAGFVTAVSRETLRLRTAVSEWLGAGPGVASLEFDPTWLLGSLRGRLEAIREAPSRHHAATILRLFGRTMPKLGVAETPRAPSPELNPAQREALLRLLGSEVQFVWGPPGTGKTRLLGQAVAELVRDGKVLVTAVTNGAVDEAAGRVVDAIGKAAAEAGRIVRVGAELSRTGDPGLSLEAALERRVRGGRLALSIRELERELGIRTSDRGRELSHRARAYRLLALARERGDPEMLDDAARLLRDLQLRAILTLREADVVLTTLARLALWDELVALRFDSLVIDEASAAPLPYLALAAARTAGRTVAFGDFQQLPAVVVSRGEAAARWMSRDLFREAGVVDDTSGRIGLPSRRDRLCAMLDEQYRMSPTICRLVSEMFYGGRLRDAPEVAGRPQLACPLVIVDSEDERPTVERAEGSRANATHIGLVLRLLEALAGSGIADVAVVTPYRLQVRRLAEAVRAQLGDVAPRGLEIATIHRFQGREKSIVVFDTVDAPPGRSWFLHEGRNPDLPRLVNVALSRARHGLVLVGTIAGLRQTLPPDALINHLVARVAAQGAVVRAAELGDSLSARSLWGPVSPAARLEHGDRGDEPIP